MALRVRSTTWLAFSQLASVSICLCTVVFSPLHQHAVPACAGSAEERCPCQEEDTDPSERELTVSSSACRRSNDPHHSGRSWAHETGHRLHQIVSHVGRLPATIGHQLANGLRAPLLV